MRPLVSVLLPAFNAAPWLRVALDSVSRQSHDHLQIIAIDDGSRDGTPGLLAGAAAADARLEIVTLAENGGIIAALNSGIARARGDFIARMDADDWCDSRRIERQLGFLAAHPGCDVVSLPVVHFTLDPADGRRTFPRARHPRALRFLAFVATPLNHPAALFRSTALATHRYRSDPATLHCEDYDLWLRMLAAGRELAVLDEPLYAVRLRHGRVSDVHESTQITSFIRLSHQHLERYLGETVAPGVHRVVVNRMSHASAAEVVEGAHLLDRLAERYLREERHDQSIERQIRGVVAQQKLDVLIQLARHQRGLLGKPGVLRSLRAGVSERAALRYLWSKLFPRRP